MPSAGTIRPYVNSCWIRSRKGCVCPRFAPDALTKETIVTDINDNQSHSRPSRYTLLAALGVFIGAGVILYWAELSALTHLPQIRQALGL